ncbi:MAG: hypothetical protein WC515_00720 [Candidatus Omnitrophota bacterium]
MTDLILLPPVSFIIVLAVMMAMAKLFSRLAFKSRGKDGDMRKSYACGEDVPSGQAQPDYGQFFPFAFFFTVLHVVALTISTIPAVTAGSSLIALVYISGAVTGLFILFRR